MAADGKSISKAALDAKAMLNAVGSRFVGSAEDGNATTKSHGALVRTAEIPADLLPRESTLNRIEQLSKVSKSSSSAKERKISNKAKEILMKSNAIGNASLAADDRLYVSIRFGDATADSSSNHNSSNSSSSSSSCCGGGSSGAGGGPQPQSVNFFFKKSLPLGDVLYQTGQAFPQLCYGTAVAPEGKALAMSSTDTPDWRSWDRSLTMDKLLANFEDVSVTVVSVDEAVAAQRDLEELKLRVQQAADQAAAEELALVEAEATARLAKEGEEDVLKHPLTKGEQVHYFSKGVEGVETVSVVGVHLDDFPNVYYTVRFDSAEGSRWDRLCPPPPVPLSQGHPLPAVGVTLPTEQRARPPTEVSSACTMSAAAQKRGYWEEPRPRAGEGGGAGQVR